MAWKVRGNGRKYYYRTQRAGTLHITEYYGRGPTAELVAEMDTADIEARRAKAEKERRERDRCQKADAHLSEFAHGSDLLMQAVLVSAGYRQHDRGEWRRRMDVSETKK